AALLQQVIDVALQRARGDPRAALAVLHEHKAALAAQPFQHVLAAVELAHRLGERDKLGLGFLGRHHCSGAPVRTSASARCAMLRKLAPLPPDDSTWAWAASATASAVTSLPSCASLAPLSCALSSTLASAPPIPTTMSSAIWRSSSVMAISCSAMVAV